MKARRIKHRTSFWSYLLTAVIVFITGTIASYLYFKPKLTLEIPFIKDIKPQHFGTKPPEEEKNKSGKKTLLIEEDKEPLDDTVFATIEDAIKKHMTPYEVRLLSLYRDNEGIVYVDLSSELRKNFKGDAFEEHNIISGLYKILKENIQDFTAMKILIEGNDVNSIGGHIDISRPIGEGIEANKSGG